MTSFEIESNSNYGLQLLVHWWPPWLPQGMRRMLPLHHVCEKQAVPSHAARLLASSALLSMVITQNTAAIHKAEEPIISPFHPDGTALMTPIFSQMSPQGPASLPGRLLSRQVWLCRTQPWLSMSAKPGCCRSHSLRSVCHLPLKYRLAYWVISCVLLTQNDP